MRDQLEIDESFERNEGLVFSDEVRFIMSEGFVIHEFFSVLDGEKPALVASLNSSDRASIIENCFPGIKVRLSKGDWRGRFLCGISLDESLAEEAADYLSYDIGKQGRLLGYPECCVASHVNRCAQGVALNAPTVTYENYLKSRRFSPLANNLFNFYSRLGNSEENFKKFDAYAALNEDALMRLLDLQFISHIPCRYDCEASIKRGMANREILKKYAPGLDSVILNSLARPIIFFDLFEWLILNGEAEGNVVKYKGVLPPFSLVDASLSEAVMRGNRLAVKDDVIDIYADDSLIFSYKKKDIKDGILLDFSDKKADKL